MPRTRGANRPRFRLLPTVLLTAAILGLPTVVYAWGRNSSSFTITQVRVTGTKRVPEKQVLKLLRREYRGRNLFTVTVKDVRATLAPLSFVADAKVDRDFPSTLRVRVVEHVPFVYALSRGRWYVLTADGYAICQLKEAATSRGKKTAATPSPAATAATSEAAAMATTDATAATTTGVAAPTASPTAATNPTETSAGEGSGTAVSAGQGAAASGEDERAAASILAALTAGPAGAAFDLPRVAVAGRLRAGKTTAERDLRDVMGVIAALPRYLYRRLAAAQGADGQISLRFEEGPMVTWGDTSRMRAKTIALRLVLAKYETAGMRCTVMDVSIPDRVVAKPVLE